MIQHRGKHAKTRSRERWLPSAGAPAARSPRLARDAGAQRIRVWSLVWALTPILTLGFGTPFVIAHAAGRLKSRGLTIAACAYAVALVASLAITPDSDTGVRDQIGVALFSAVILLGTVHALALRTTVFDLDSLDSARWARRRRGGQAFAGPVHRSRSDGRQHGPFVHPPSKSNKVWSWIWALSPLLSGSILAAPALAYGASRLRSRRLWAWSFVFAGIFLVCMVVFDQTSSSSLASDVTAWVVGGCATAVALATRKSVFEVDVVRSALQQRRAALRIVAQDPVEAIRLGIGRVDVPDHQRYPDGGLIDVNNIPWSSIRERLGLDSDGAARLLSIRKDIWGLESVADLYGLMGFDPQQFDSVRDRLIFLPYMPNPPGLRPWSPRASLQARGTRS